MSLGNKILVGLAGTGLIALTFFITKWIYKKPDPYFPKIEVGANALQLNDVELKGRIAQVELPRPIINAVIEKDTVIRYDTTRFVKIAKSDTSIVIPSQAIKFKDTTFHTKADTLKIQSKYLYEPVNKFHFNLVNKHKCDFFIYRNIERVYIPKPKTFFDRFGLGVAIGGTVVMMNNTDIYIRPSITVGLTIDIY